MNRHERRAAAAAGAKKPSSSYVVCLDLNCAGPASTPRRDCLARVQVPMPFDLDGLRHRVMSKGWWVTMTSPPGTSPLTVTALCGDCAKAILPPELLSAAKRHAPGSA